MFKRNLIPVWVGILMMASFFLVGQDWGPSSTGGSLHVIDADGNDVGLYVESNEIFFPSSGLIFNFDAWTGEVSADSSGAFRVYESIDCTGDAYTHARRPWSTFSFSGESPVYVVSEVGIRTIRSSYGPFDECEQYTEPYEQRVATTWTTVTVPGPFPAPLGLEVE